MMNLWTHWLNVLNELLNYFSSTLGLGVGFGIVALTIAVRTALLPVAWPIAYRAAIRNKKVLRLKDELATLKERYSGEPRIYAEQMMSLYRRHDIALFDGRGFVGALIQMPILLGVFQTLRTGFLGVRFLWVQSLAHPDVWLALLAGITTVLVSAVNPDLPQSMRLILILVPGLLALLFALKWGSGLALYWTVSNCFSVMQTWILQTFIARRIRLGAVKV